MDDKMMNILKQAQDIVYYHAVDADTSCYHDIIHGLGTVQDELEALWKWQEQAVFYLKMFRDVDCKEYYTIIDRELLEKQLEALITKWEE